MARITVKLGGRDVAMRVPTKVDFFAIFGALPLLPTEASPAKDGGVEWEALAPDVRMRRYVEMIDKADALLERCSIPPGSVTREVPAIEDGRFILAEIDPDERLAAFQALSKASGWTREAAAALDPLSAGGAPSSGSIASPDGTGADPATSSTES